MKNERDKLNEAIIVLQVKRKEERMLLREQLHIIYESIKPINLIKNTLKDISSSSEIKSKILDNAIGIGTGYLSKK